MSKDSAGRRAWIKNAAIIFLVILLLLTFFSNTILNYSLPEVSAQYAQSGTLSSAIKVSGTVKANASYNVVYEADAAESEDGVTQSRKVMSVYVKEGDTVEKDAPILELKGGASEQLEAAQNEYDTLKREYDLALLGDTVSSLNSQKSITDARKALSDAKEELASLQKNYNDLLSGVDASSIIESQIEELEDQIDTLTEQQTELSTKITEVQGIIDKANAMIEEDILSTLTVSEKLAIAEDDYYIAKDSYETLKKEVDFYKERLDEIKGISGDVSEANTLTNTLKTLEDSLSKLEKERQRYIEDNSGIDENYVELKEAYDQANKEYKDYYSQNENYVMQAQNEIKLAQEKLSKLSALEENYANAMTEWGYAAANYDEEYAKNPESKELLNKLKAELDDAINKVEQAKAALEGIDEKREAANNELKEANAKLDEFNNLVSKLQAAENALNNYTVQGDDNSTFLRKLEDYAEQIDELERQIREVKDKLEVIGMPEVDDLIDYTVDYDLASAQKDYDEASAKLTEVEQTYTEAKTKYESLMKQSTAEGTASEYTVLLETYKNEKKSLDDDVNAKNKQLTKLREQLNDASSALTPEELQKQIKEKSDSISTLESQLKITEATELQNNTKTELDREDQKKKLDELSAKIESYKNAPETTSVTAPIAGRIVSINFVPGDTVTSGNTVASIEIADKGYICEITMSSDQARKIQVGTPCSVVNSWWYSNIEASVTAMRSDPQSQGKNRIITITVTGDVYEGQSLNFSIGDKSQSYDSVLPNSAIREDNDGKFVLVVESKKTPLNMRYTAKRVDIEVIASDDTQSAVSGLYGSEFVITNSTVPISDKQQVRLAEN